MNYLRPLLVAAALLASHTALAGDLSKEECVDAHSRGQDAREQGKLSLARKLFLSCAQSGCPAIVSNDCARFADDLGRLQPSVTFAARDAGGADLPDTSVYVDDALVVTRLDDGKPHDVDPGKHVVKFQSAGKEVTVTVVVSAGEKGRAVVGKFAELGAAPATLLPGALTAAPREAPLRTTHPTGAKVLLGAGGVVFVAGVALGVYGMTKIPSNCSLSSHTCTAPPGDPVFDDAKKNVRLADIGFVAGGVGLAALAAGTYWYLSGAKSTRAEHLAVVPWLGPNGAGVGVAGSL